MVPSIYPCLWFNNNGKEAADFYCATFRNSRILTSTHLVTIFELNGIKMMTLNGGDRHSMTPAVSYFVYCNGEQEINNLYETLKEGGHVVMELGKYDWSPRYAWVQDRFGVNWQLDVEEIRNNQKIAPNLLFVNQKNVKVKEAREWYLQVFPNSIQLMDMTYPPEAGMPDGSLLFAQFKMNGLIMNAMSSTMQHDYDFTPGNSFVIECKNQQEIDYYWELLGKGGRYDMCGWLADQFGVSWQVVPEVLPSLMNDTEKGQRVIEAFLKMQKIDIETLFQG